MFHPLAFPDSGVFIYYRVLHSFPVLVLLFYSCYWVFISLRCIWRTIVFPIILLMKVQARVWQARLFSFFCLYSRVFFWTIEIGELVYLRACFRFITCNTRVGYLGVML